MAVTLGVHTTKFTFISVAKSDHSMDFFQADTYQRETDTEECDEP